MRRELRQGKDRDGVGDRLKMPRRQKEIRGRLEDRPRLAFLVAELRRLAEPTYEDRPMDCDIEALAGRISAAGFPGEG